MMDEQQKIKDDPLWQEDVKKCQQSIELWQKTSESLEEALEQSRRLGINLSQNQSPGNA